ncbi:MAG: hypothetical protein Q8L88_07565 [Bacteroidota bacterium]|nr:hypothetical protein [Bacteroidota bacterium]
MQTSLLHSKRHWLKLFVVLFATLPFSYNCFEQPADFKAPMWETPLNLTLVKKTFFFSDVVNKDPKFDTTTGVVLYKPTENAIGSKQGISKDVFTMPSPKGNTIQQEIGVVPVDIGNQPPASITANQLGIKSSDLNPSIDPQIDTLSPSQLGLPVGVPFVTDLPAIQIDQNFGDTTQYTYLVFANGTMSLKITNNFPFAIKFANNQLRLVNFNTINDTNQTVAAFVFSGQIDAGTFAISNPVLLAGVTMDGILKLKGSMSTVGATGKQLNASHNIISELSVTNAQIQSMVPEPSPLVLPLNEVFGDSTEFKYIVFENGQMSLTINNSFPFDIQFVGNSLVLVNKNDTTQVVGTFVFPGKITGKSAPVSSNLVQLANKRMDAILKLKGTVNVSNYLGKTILNNDILTSTLSLTNGFLQSALVNTINFNPTSVLAVNDSGVLLDEKIKVKLAKFESGEMEVRIENRTALKLSVKFRISELKDNLKGGKVFSLAGADQDTIVTIDPGVTLSEKIQMKNVSFVSRDITPSGDTSVTQKLHFGLEIKTLKASSGYILVNKTDLVVAEVKPDSTLGFVLSEIQGKIPPETLLVNQSFDVGIGDIGNNLTLKGIKSAINLSTIVDLRGKLFPTDVNLYIVPVNKSGGYADSVHITKRIQSGISIIPIDTASVNKLMNSFLASLGELPSKFLVRGNVIISPLDLYENNSNATIGVGGITQKDSVFVNLDYAIPVAIGIKDGLLKNPPTEFSETLPDTALVNLIKNGKIYLDITNTFPLDVELQLKLLKGILPDKKLPDTISAPVLTIPQSLTDTVNYPPLRILADTTTNRTGQRSFTFLNLTPDDAKKLNEAAFSAVDLKMKTSGNGNSAKVFNLTDKLEMTVKANIIFLVDQDKLK